MTEFSIYQINTDRDDNCVCFLGLDTLERFQHSKAVDPALYDRVYDGKLDCNSLETIYEKFNIDHPADYKGRSLSVSDVVEIRESDTLNPSFYFVDSIGFKAISFDKALCKEPVEVGSGKISVLLVEPNKYPKMIEIDDTLEAMQTVVGGDIEEYMPFEDEVAIICNEEGKVNGLTPNRAVYEENSREMQDKFPELAKEWSPKNEPLRPSMITAATHRKVIWQCKLGHEWTASVKSRTVNGTGCPYCSHNFVLPGFNDLASRFPEIAAEWSERNLPLTPDQVTAFKNIKVWWKCHLGHEWNTLISTRAGGSQCPYLSLIHI